MAPSRYKKVMDAETILSNNAFSNLFCLHKLDHRKLHSSSKEEIPF